MSKKSTNNQAGKGDAPRNCFSKKYRDNYDLIDWTKKLSLSENEQKYVEQIKNEPPLHISSTSSIN